MKNMKKQHKTLFSLQAKNNKEAHELSIALSMVGLNTNIMGADLIIETLKAKEIMKGKFDLQTAAKITAMINEKYEKIQDIYDAHKDGK